MRDSSLSSGTPIKSLAAVEWLDGGGTADQITAPWIGALTVTGRKANAKANLLQSNGNFQADLLLSPRPVQDAKVKAALGTVKIAGSLSADLWDIAGAVAGISVGGWARNRTDNGRFVLLASGNMGAVTVGGAEHLDLLAGVRPAGTGEDFRHAAVSADFNAPPVNLQSFTVKGWKVGKGQSLPPLFVDCNVSAAGIGAVTLMNAGFNNNQTGLDEAQDNFGFWTKQGVKPTGITSVKHTDTTDPKNKAKNWTWKPGLPPPGILDDLNIQPLV